MERKCQTCGKLYDGAPNGDYGDPYKCDECKKFYHPLFDTKIIDASRVNPKKCLCGREIKKEFIIGPEHNIKIILCPYCAYEIMIQNIIYNYSRKYILDVLKAAKNRRQE